MAGARVSLRLKEPTVESRKDRSSMAVDQAPAESPMEAFYKQMDDEIFADLMKNFRTPLTISDTAIS